VLLLQRMQAPNADRTQTHSLRTYYLFERTNALIKSRG